MQILLILCCLLAASLSFAQNKNTFVCPEAKSLRKYAPYLDAYYGNETKFVSYTYDAVYKYQSYQWQIFAGNGIYRISEEEALAQGQTILKNASFKMNQYPEFSHCVYFCFYDNNQIMISTLEPECDDED